MCVKVFNIYIKRCRAIGKKPDAAEVKLLNKISKKVKIRA